MSVAAPQGQTLTIEYHVPDMQLLDEDDEEKGEINEAELLEGAAKVGKTEGLDSQWNQRMKDKIARMKSRKMRDMSITVSQKTNMNDGASRKRVELTKTQGTIDFLTADSEGLVDICIQSIVASKEQPSRYSLNVKMSNAEEEEEEEKGRGDEKEENQGEGLLNHQVKTEMTRVERDLQTLSNRVKSILNNADFNKNQEVAFHEQSIAMNRAATYWPIIQMGVLLITGFTQANHIVRYMKSRHII